MKTIYIAGPMRGYPRYNFDAFYEAEEALCLEYHTINPARMDEAHGFNPDRDEVTPGMMSEFFDRDIAAIKRADAIALLPGWIKSKGATAEAHIARWLGKEIYLYPAMIKAPDLATEVQEGQGHRCDEDILEEALRLTSGDRNNSYGPPDQDFKRTAAMWSAILGVEVQAKHVALCMIVLKVSRATWASKRDNWTDIAGYARCGFLCEEVSK